MYTEWTKLTRYAYHILCGTVNAVMVFVLSACFVIDHYPRSCFSYNFVMQNTYQMTIQ